ncbi:hypothetical protein V8F06_004910 [Rhypophila decipiens]
MDSKIVCSVAASANDVEMVDAPAQPAPAENSAQLSKSPSSAAASSPLTSVGPSPSPSPGPLAGSSSSGSSLASSAPPSPSPSPQPATSSDEAEESGSDYSTILVESFDFGDSSSPEPLPRSALKRPVGSPTPEPAPPTTARVIILRFKVQEWYDSPGTVEDRGKTIGRLDGLCVNRVALLSSAGADESVGVSEDVSSSTAGVLSSLVLAGLNINYNEDRLLAVDLHAALAWLYANNFEEDYVSFIATCQREIPLLKWLKQFRHVLVPASQLAAHVLVRPGEPGFAYGYISPPKLPVEDMGPGGERSDKMKMLGIWRVDVVEEEQVSLEIFCGTLVGGPSAIMEDDDRAKDLVTIEIQGLSKAEFEGLAEEAGRVLEIVGMIDPAKREPFLRGAGAGRTGTTDCFAVEAIKYVWTQDLDEEFRDAAEERMVKYGGEGWYPGLEWLWMLDAPKMRFVRRPGQLLV